MDKLNGTILKTAIEAIPLLTMDNFTLWRNRVENLLDLQELRKPLTDPKGVLKAFQDVQLRTVLTSKLNPSIHNNVINHQNKKDSRLIWASIMEFFASSQPSNRARVFKELLRLKFNINDITGFITNVKTTLARFHEIGIDLPDDILTYLILDKLPPALDNVSERITHSDKNISPELDLEQLRIYANDCVSMASGSGTKINPISLFTDSSKKCQRGAHNTLADHNEAHCWFVHPEQLPSRSPRFSGSKVEVTNTKT
ncbi:hypothetical protein VP01_2670g5 [Puccinia sorghi]|uniref:DUF4219 domain-containing protein n=1 Tax=Puccinia sorghi TaxID=27349 RepID=A0A0L6V410_9BASI|nr:hypothetical protein VP01_2670g5 [Puccinia sorghi]